MHGNENAVVSSILRFDLSPRCGFEQRAGILHGNACICMGMYGNAWECIGTHGNACESMGMRGYAWI